MKLGILSFQQAINYGATLQIFALQETIKKEVSTDVEVEILNYQQPKLTKAYSVIQKQDEIIKDIGRNILYFPSRYIKKKKFNNFFDKNFTFTTKINNLNDLEYLDTVVVGSDQVWNSNIHDYDTTYLLDTNVNINKISYAASIGKNTLTDKDKELFRKFLPSFSAISVREETGAKLLSKIIDKKISVTLDPTLLLSADDWRKVSKKQKPKEKYIAVYCLEPNEELDRVADKVSKELKLPIKYLMPKGDNLFDRISTEYSYSPSDFLNIIDNSEFVITNSFHGTCFSVIFNKNFFTVPHTTVGSRMTDLLEKLQLKNRIIYNSSTLEKKPHLLKKIEYAEANTKLESLKNESIKYLTGNIY